MCECGCISNDRKYWLPAPGQRLYIITLSGHCTNCDAPAGITIECIEESNLLYRSSRRIEFGVQKLELQDWPDSKGVAIVTGFRKHEFVSAIKQHLVGQGFDALGIDDNGVVDDVGAECLLEELYEDSQVRPKIVMPKD